MRHPSGLLHLLAAALSLALAPRLAAESIIFTHGGPASQLVEYKINGGASRFMNTVGQTETAMFGNTTATLTITLVRVGSTTLPSPVVIATLTGNNGTAPHHVTVYTTGEYGGPPITWKLNGRTLNDTGFPVFYDVYIDGVKVATSPPVPPGGYWEFGYSDDHKAEIQFRRYRYGKEGQETDITYSRTIGTDDPNWHGGEGPPPTSSDGTDDSIDVPDAKEGLDRLNFGDTDDLAKEATLRRGFEVLYDATQQGLGSTINELRGISGKISGGNATVASAVGAVGSKVDGLGTKLDAINSTAQQIKSGVDAANSNLDQLETVGNAINTSIGLGNGKLDTVTTRIEAGNTHLVGIKAGIDAGKLTMDEIELGVLNLNTKLSDANSELDNITLAAQQTREEVAAQTANDNVKAGEIVAAATATRDAVSAQMANDNTHHGQAQNSRTDIKNAVDGVKNEVTAFKNANHADLDGLRQQFDKNMATNANGFDQVRRAVDTNTLSTSNLLEKLNKTLTNAPAEPSIATQIAQGQGAAGTVSGTFTSLAGDQQGPGSVSIGDNGDAWEISFGFGAFDWTIDCNPKSYPGVVALAAKTKTLIVWLVTGIYAFAVWQILEKYLVAGTHLQQARAAGTTVLGTNINTGIAIAAAGAITVAIAAIPALGVAAYYATGATTMLPGISSELSTGPNVFLMAMELADMFIPFTVILADIGLYLVFRFQIVNVYWIAATVVRFIVG